MFELAILSLILFAAAYVALLWLAGRRDDVLFGAFVEEPPAQHATELN